MTTSYPYILDSTLTLPTVSGIDPEPTAINALQSAVVAIEKELGIKPAQPYTDVRARLDILESRYNNPYSPVLPDGYANSPMYIVNGFYNFTVSISTGLGAPTENRVDGSLYIRADGYSYEGLYARRNNTWVRFLSEEDAFEAGGDLTGDNKIQIVGQRKSFLFSGM